MSALADKYAALKTAVENIAGDVAKTDTGVKASGTRVRKAMQEVKGLAQDIRKLALENRKGE